MFELMEYLKTLTPEEMKVAIGSLPDHQKIMLIGYICGTVDDMAQSIVQNSEEIWEDR